MAKQNLSKSTEEFQMLLRNQDEFILNLVEEEKESKLKCLTNKTIILYKEFLQVKNPFIRMNGLIFLDKAIGYCIKKINEDYFDNIKGVINLYQEEKEILNL